MLHRTLSGCVVVTLLLTACQTGSETGLPVGNISASLGQCGGTYNAFPGYFDRLWNCDQRDLYLHVQTSDQQLLDSLRIAAAAWNDGFPSEFEVPRFKIISNAAPSATYIGRTVPVRILGSSSGTEWCGRNFPQGEVELHRIGPGVPCPDATLLKVTTMMRLARHELGHALGYGSRHLNQAGEPTTTGCVMHVNPSSFNTTPCTLEKQIMYWVYMLRTTSPDIATFYLRNMVVNPSSATTQVGATQQFTASMSFAIEEYNGPIPTVNWTRSNPAVASFVGQPTTSAVLSANAAGQTAVTATVPESPSTPWPALTSSAVLTVVPAPPPPPPPVASITVEPASVALGAYEDASLVATAWDANGNPIPGLTYTWSVKNTAIIWFGSSGQSAWVAAKHDGTTKIFVSAGGQTAIVTVTVTGCPVHCAA